MEQLPSDEAIPGAALFPKVAGALTQSAANQVAPPLSSAPPAAEAVTSALLDIPNEQAVQAMLIQQNLSPFVSAHNAGQLFVVRFLLRQLCQPVETIHQAMSTLGYSVQVEGDERELNISITTLDPGAPLSYAVRQGVLAQVVVENLAGRLTGSPPSGPASADDGANTIGVLALVQGQGFAELFQQQGVIALMTGLHNAELGLEVLIDAIRQLPNRRVIVLPNSNSLVGTAQAAAQWFTQGPTTRQVLVIPNKSTPQGLGAARVFNPNAENLERLLAQMQEEMALIDTGEVTQAVRNAEFDGITVGVGDFIGLHDGRLVTRGGGLQQVVRSLLEQMAADESRRITIYYGDFISAEAAENLIETVRTHYPEIEVKLAYGGQAHYHYILSTE